MYKALYPNSLERQHVKLALKVFDEKTAVALVHYGNQNQIDMNGAHQFICLIIKLWHVLNVKSLNKGIKKRDSDSDPYVLLMIPVLYFCKMFTTG